MNRSREPSSKEVVLLAVCAYAALAAGVQLATWGSGFWRYEPGDTFSYAEITTAIRTGDFSGLREVRHFWGLPYLAAPVALLTGVPDLIAVLLVSLFGSIATVLLVRRLWGGWIAAFFTLVSWDWLQASVFGGSETVFTALTLIAFLAARRERWALAALAAACSTTVRPVGAFVFAALAVVLLWRREFRKATIVGSVGAAVVVLYVLPLWIVRGDVLAHVRGYQHDWAHRWPIGVPFAALMQGMLAAETPFKVLRPAMWAMFILVSTTAMPLRQLGRSYTTRCPVEALFAMIYTAFLFTYNADYWAWSEFPRFAIPVLPFALLAAEPWLPKDRRLLWLLAPTSGVLAACWLIGFHRTLAVLRAGS